MANQLKMATIDTILTLHRQNWSIRRIAATLGIPAERLHQAIAATFTERATGACGDLEQTMRWLACGDCTTSRTIS